MADDNELEKLLEDLTEFTDRPNNNTLAELLGKLAFLIVKEGKHIIKLEEDVVRLNEQLSKK